MTCSIRIFNFILPAGRATKSRCLYEQSGRGEKRGNARVSARRTSAHTRALNFYSWLFAG
jgi:hypothetical protein